MDYNYFHDLLHRIIIYKRNQKLCLIIYWILILIVSYVPPLPPKKKCIKHRLSNIYQNKCILWELHFSRRNSHLKQNISHKGCCAMCCEWTVFLRLSPQNFDKSMHQHLSLRLTLQRQPVLKIANGVHILGK